MQTFPIYVGGRAEGGSGTLEVRDKYTGEVAARVGLASAGEIERGIAAADKAAGACAAMRPYERKAVLEHCVRRFRERFDELAHWLCVECGKPIVYAEGEVHRLIDTFEIAARESVQIGGEVLNLELSERQKGYRGYTKRVPVGPCSFISPFNFPLNLVAHKVAPAIAAGCPFVLKPASRTPVGAAIIGGVLAEAVEAGLYPEGAFSVLPCERGAAGAFTTDERLKMLSFTGSDEAGWKLKAQAGKKRVVLELGGNAACIVDETMRGADLDDAVGRIVFGAMYQSGQSCISVQRLIVHGAVYDELKARLVERVAALKAGDPKDRETFIGPLITEQDADRVIGWIEEAEGMGGRRLCGGERVDPKCRAVVSPAVLEGVPAGARIVRDELFGPAVVLSRVPSFEEALAQANDTRYGLQAGVFTRDLHRMHRAWETLRVGGVIVGDVPSWRVDSMPYGGVRDSGIGREGVRDSIEAMTEVRLLVVRERADGGH